MSSPAPQASANDWYVQCFQFLIQDDAGRVLQTFEPQEGLIRQLENELRWSLEVASPARDGCLSVKGPAGLWFKVLATGQNVQTPAGQRPGLAVSLCSHQGYAAETETAIAELGEALAQFINSTLPVPIGTAVVAEVDSTYRAA